MPKILITDDTAFMRKMLGDILKKNGYEIVGEAANGLEAVEKYKELQPDIVTMDITMPKLDGISAANQIHQLDRESKIIMVSAMGQEAMIIDAMKAGARGFIIKPFQESKIIEEITKLLIISEDR